MDGLLSGLLTVSLLTATLALEPAASPRQRLGWAALAGPTFGLAFLTKTTALLAGPMVPALAVLAGWQAFRQPHDPRPWRQPRSSVLRWPGASWRH